MTYGEPTMRGGSHAPTKNFTLTAPQVHRCAAVVLQDHLKLGDHGPKCRASLLFTLLLYAAARITSLSDACKTLRDAPSDEAALGPHRHLARFCRRLILRFGGLFQNA